LKDVRRITSRANPLVARFRDAARGRGPDGTVLLDGAHLVEEALASGVRLDIVAVSDAVLDDRVRALEPALSRTNAEIVGVPATVLAAMSPVRQPSGIVALAEARPVALDQALTSPMPLVLVLDGVQDAGNVGAIVRAADACGATGLVTTAGTADPFGWKALRGAMGSTFRVPIAAGHAAADIVTALRARAIATLATVPRTGTALPACNLRRPIAILLGAEGAGLSEALRAAASERLSIPMRAPVESLNVAVSAALILYEAAQQRDGYVPLPRS
jgi:TrmH family RNA methyltransferase